MPEYEYVPETTNNEITTVDSLEEYYLLVPDHVKFVYFVYFMVHSSRREGDDLRVVANEEESEDAKKKRLMTKSSAIVFCNSCKAAQLLSELLRVFHVGRTASLSRVDQQRVPALASRPEAARRCHRQVPQRREPRAGLHGCGVAWSGHPAGGSGEAERGESVGGSPEESTSSGAI